MPVRIGATGRAVTPLRPTGFITIDGIRLEAKLAPSASASVDFGTEMVVVGTDPFGLLVRARADVADLTALPDYGTEVPTPAEQSQFREEDERLVWEEERELVERSIQRETMFFALPLFGVFGIGYTAFGINAAFSLAAAWVALFLVGGFMVTYFGAESGE